MSASWADPPPYPDRHRQYRERLSALLDRIKEGSPLRASLQKCIDALDAMPADQAARFEVFVSDLGFTVGPARDMNRDILGTRHNPGSDEARGLGCTCPTLANNLGRFPSSPGLWRVTEGCPVHTVGWSS